MVSFNTAHVERLPSGDVVKYPMQNPYWPQEEEHHRRDMRVEAQVYQRVGASRFIPRLVHWDPDSCSLTLGYLENGNLATFMQKWKENQSEDISSGQPALLTDEVRRRWTIQAAMAVATLHAANVIHCDVTPRNFLLDEALNLHIADFAGCSVDGSVATVAAGPRFLPPGWDWRRTPSRVHDTFALGSVLYFIMVGTEPYADLSEADVEGRFRAGEFPDVSGLACDYVIRGCWEGRMTAAQQVAENLTSLYADS